MSLAASPLSLEELRLMQLTLPTVTLLGRNYCGAPSHIRELARHLAVSASGQLEHEVVARLPRIYSTRTHVTQEYVAHFADLSLWLSKKALLPLLSRQSQRKYVARFDPTMMDAAADMREILGPSYGDALCDVASYSVNKWHGAEDIFEREACLSDICWNLAHVLSLRSKPPTRPNTALEVLDLCLSPLPALPPRHRYRR